MPQRLALMLSDIVDSTGLHQTIGEAKMAELWARHDRAARQAIRDHGGREIGRSDGLLAAFASAASAVAFAGEYHRALAALHPGFRARVGLCWDEVSLRPNSAQDIAGGATLFEVDGVALPLVARVMAVAQGGQTLATEGLAAEAGLEGRSHGHWRLKGLAEPVALVELPTADLAPILPPEDGAKGYRVVCDVDGTWKPAREIPHNLHLARDRFFGRRDTLQALAREFDDGARLVTLMGIGGLGKTRCALAFARATLGDFPGGVWFCDLSAATSLDGIAYAVASALDVPLGTGDVLRKLGAAIAGRGSCLVVLDNFEQVARHAEASIGVWLMMAPQAGFLVTSREMLGIAGERALPLAPLSTDEAVELFRDRAQAAGVWLDAEPAALLAQLVQTLDRLPLAIELAAARAPLLAPQQMLERMRERFRLLAAPGVRHDRQATLMATLDWSWDLLDTAERQALLQVSVFEGGFTLDAAEAVVVLTHGVQDRPVDAAWDVDAALQGLLRKSLLRADARHRFELLRSVQDYAAQRLDSMQGRVAAESRHAAFYAAFDEARATAQRGIELDNLVAACRRSTGRDAACAARTLFAAWCVLRLSGPFAVALALADAVEAAGGLSDADAARLDRVIGGSCTLLGDPQRAQRRLVACAEGAQRRGDHATAAAALAQLAALDLAAGHTDIADLRLDEALRLSVAGVDADVRIRVLGQLGSQRLAQGRFDDAEKAYAESLALAERFGIGRWIGGAHGNLGVVALMRGRRDAARAHIERALALAGDLGDRQWEGNSRCNLGVLLNELGERGAARRELQASLDTARAIGHKRLEAMASCNLGLVHEAEGDFAVAVARQRQALSCATELQDETLASRFQAYLGVCLARAGAHAEAMPHLAAAEAGFAALVGDSLSAATLAAQLSVAASLRIEASIAAHWHAEALARVEGISLDLEGETQRLIGESGRLASGQTADHAP